MSSFASKASIKAGAALALYVSIYRTVLQLLLIVRAKTLIPKLQAWAAKHQNPAQRTASSSKRVIVPEEPSRRSRAQIRLVKFLQSSSLAPFLASNMATLALLLLPPALRGYIALDILVKGLQFSYDEARKQGSRLVKWVPDWMGGGLLYALGNGQLLYAFLFEPQSFPGGYGNIILAVSMRALYFGDEALMFFTTAAIERVRACKASQPSSTCAMAKQARDRRHSRAPLLADQDAGRISLLPLPATCFPDTLPTPNVRFPHY